MSVGKILLYHPGRAMKPHIVVNCAGFLKALAGYPNSWSLDKYIYE